MQRTMRQSSSAAKDIAAIRSAARANSVVQPSYPLLRMSLFSMANLAAAYATLITIPTAVSGETTSTNNTLPSLPWTVITLFAFQTTAGLIQAYLHKSNQPAAVGKKGKARSSSLFSVLNTSIAIGAVGAVICHAFVVLFGAGFVNQAKETSQLACYLSLLTFYPASFVLGTDLKSWQRIFIHNSPQTYTEAALYSQGMLAIFGAWLGSIVIPLDWDRPWQAWPVPCVLGAFLFYSIGAVTGLVVSVLMRRQALKIEFGIDSGVKKSTEKVKDN
ncbi:GPI biosynthesis protein family Pig-F-domain-containing protein [Mortierella sp. GBAus27b]|nr:GPI biosynthesis protein family Pig-F-domain-containing protein [Mortierella sp. GBAus27b]